MDEAWQKWFEAVWAEREEGVYPRLFGEMGAGIYPIPISTFQSIGFSDPDPRFLTHGVFESPPSHKHPDWIYVTSAMSNPWGDSPETVRPNAPSGLGFEFTLHTRERARFAIEVLHWLMAVQLMVAAGRLQGELLHRHDRIPLGGALPTAQKNGVLTYLLACSPEERGHNPEERAGDPQYPGEFSLASGQVELLLMVGITQKESEFAKTQGAEGLITLLRHQGVFPLTDPERVSVV